MAIKIYLPAVIVSNSMSKWK